jgi:hypothetical protein
MALQIVVIGALVMLPNETRLQPVSASQSAPFDHSQCQYPTRTTNPPNGCDNSDPCDPIKTKNGSGDCEPMSTPEIPMSPPMSTVTPAQPELVPFEGK